jgi:hypothetical protein
VTLPIIPFFIIILLFTHITFGCKRKIRPNNQDEINFSFHEQNFGESAGDLLRDDKYKSLKVEIQYMDGFKPDPKAVLNLKDFLTEHLNKPKGIRFVLKKINPISDTILTRNEVTNLRRAKRTIYTMGDQLAVCILYTNGEFENNNILGEAFRNTTIVIYGKSVKANSNTFRNPTPTTLETELLLHEVGHLLGLVNKGSSMNNPHKDSLHEGHCENEKCVMYWTIGTRSMADPRIKRSAPNFDRACLQDLKANGGK